MKGLAAALKVITKAAPGLRAAGVSALRLEGFGEITLARPEAAQAPRQPLSETEAKERVTRARGVLREAGGLNDAQTDDLMADLRRFD